MLSEMQRTWGKLGYKRNNNSLHDVLKKYVEGTNADGLFDKDSEHKFEDYVHLYDFGEAELMLHVRIIIAGWSTYITAV